MFKAPSDDTIKCCRITKEVVCGEGKPVYEYDEEPETFAKTEIA